MYLSVSETGGARVRDDNIGQIQGQVGPSTLPMTEEKFRTPSPRRDRDQQTASFYSGRLRRCRGSSEVGGGQASKPAIAQRRSDFTPHQSHIDRAAHLLRGEKWRLLTKSLSVGRRGSLRASYGWESGELFSQKLTGRIL